MTWVRRLQERLGRETPAPTTTGTAGTGRRLGRAPSTATTTGLGSPRLWRPATATTTGPGGRRLWRAPALLVVGVAVAGGLAIDRDRPPAEAVAFGGPPAAPMPVAPPADALTSTFYCPGVPSQPERDGPRTGAITILNPGDVPMAGTLTAFPSNSFETIPAGEPQQVPEPGTVATQAITVPPRARVVIPIPVQGLVAAAM
jgi:hypothetical protein